MRHHRLPVIAIGAALAAAAAMPAAAQGYGCCGPVAAYGVPAVPLAYPPTGYVLNPSDARAPIYLVNQGPVYRGPGIFAVPTYSEGGYAFTPYPYVSGGYGYRRWGHGPRYGRYVDPSFRPYGAPPYGAYFYRPPPGARVIDVRRDYAQGPHRARRAVPGPHEAAPPGAAPPPGAPPSPPAKPEDKPPVEKWTQGAPR